MLSTLASVSEERVTFRDALRAWAYVGLNSFGGPAGQISVMHREIVERRKWVDESRFLDALNYCMLLPGPEAQQLATYTGWLLNGTRGGLAAGLLFILPGVVVLLVLSILYATYPGHDRRGGHLLRHQAGRCRAGRRRRAAPRAPRDHGTASRSRSPRPRSSRSSSSTFRSRSSSACAAVAGVARCVPAGRLARQAGRHGRGRPSSRRTLRDSRALADVFWLTARRRHVGSCSDRTTS